MERRNKTFVAQRWACLLLVMATTVSAQTADLNAARRALLLGDLETAESILAPMAEAGNADACYHYALLLEKTERDALEPLTCAANAGNTEAQYRLGLQLRKRGNSGEAHRWFSSAALEHHTGARQQLNEDRSISERERQLIKAIKAGDAAMAADIVANLGLPERADPESPTWIELAAAAGEPDLIAPLVAAGADLDTREPNGDTLLIASIRRDQSSLAIWLLDHGAKPTLADSAGYSPLHLSLALGREAVVKSLVNVLPVSALDAPDPNGRRPIEIARLAELDNVVSLLESKGVQLAEPLPEDRGATDAIYDQWPPLVVAAWRGKEDELARLLASQSALEERDPEGYTALGRAVMAGHEGALAALIRAGADVDAEQGADGLSPLMLAVRSHQPVTLEGLLVAGADPELASSAPETALMRAISLSDEEMAERLLAVNSDSPLPAAPFLAAIAARMFTVSTIIFERCQACSQQEVLNKALLAAVAAGDELILNTLLENRADPNVIADDGTPCIALAASTSPASIVQTLLRQGANPDASNSHGNTALAIAAAKDRSAVLSVLLRADVDLEVRNEDGLTPLMLAAQSGAESSVKLLLHAGAKPGRRDPRRRKAVDFARLGGYDALAQLLASAES